MDVGETALAPMTWKVAGGDARNADKSVLKAGPDGYADDEVSRLMQGR
jgi:hypothetical protein